MTGPSTGKLARRTLRGHERAQQVAVQVFELLAEALAFQDQRSTFAELSARVDATARGLLQIGIAPGAGSPSGWVNRPEWLDAMFAIMKIGAVLVPINTRFRTDDMAYVLGQSDAVAVILAERSGPVEYLAMLREVAPALGARA